jgi:predicted permease
MSRQSIEAIRQDARYALRAMRKSPAFTALAVATLALGIGVNVASFAVAYGILIRPLPYREPSRVVVLNLLFADGNDQGFSPRALRDWLPRLRTVDVAAAYYRREVTVRSGDYATVMPAALVTDQFFEVLGTPAEFGHARAGTNTPEVVVGRRAASQILRGEPLAAMSAVLSVSDTSRTISGVMPSDFAFPDDQTGLWLPSQVLNPDARPEGSGYSRIVARLKPGVTLEQVRDDVNRVRLELNPKSSDTVSVAALGESVVGGMGQLLTIVLAGSMLVLLVACANVATLFIGRDVARQRQLAARTALGATAAQLVRSVGVETLLIAVMASLVGIAVGAGTLEVFVNLASATVSGLHRVEMGLPVAAATSALTLVVTMLCGMVPAWHAARADFSPFLRANAASRPPAWRVRFALVVAQIALSCMLLIGAGLLARTVSVLMHQDHGVQPAGVLEAKVVLSDTMLFRGSGREAFVTTLLERVRAMPGVQHAGFGTNLPPRPALVTMAVDFVSDSRKERRFMKVGSATPGYLRAMGAQFVGGRDFDAADAGSGAAVVILSESAARFYFAADDPVGRTISRLPSVFGMTVKPMVVGVVRDIKYEGLDSPATSAIYIPWGLRPFGSGYLVVRTAGDPMQLAPDIRRAAHALDATVPVPELQLLADAMAQSIASRRVRALPAVGFGLLAVGVAFVGLLATLSTLVVERRRELAIRSALGASPRQLARRIVGQGMALTVVGLAMGLGLGSAGARALSALLYRVSPLDPMTFAGAALVIGVGAMLTTYLAAWRARSIDPLAVLRDE